MCHSSTIIVPPFEVVLISESMTSALYVPSGIGGMAEPEPLTSTVEVSKENLAIGCLLLRWWINCVV